MTNITQQREAVSFFAANAGTAQLAGETFYQAVGRCAAELADAEEWASQHGIMFDWEWDDMDSSEFSDAPEPWQLWRCTAFADDESDALESVQIVAMLGGVDFGPDGHPSDDDYSRVVEAELAEEARAYLTQPMGRVA